MLRQVMPVEKVGVLFLEMTAIFKDQIRNIFCCFRCVDLAPESVADEARQISGMIEMRMGKDDSVNVARRNG